MPALFPRRANRVFARALLAAAVVAVGIPLALMALVRTPVVTGQHRVVPQPVPFDHRLHAADFQIDCRYCHTTVERASLAGLPATEKCVACHEPVWIASSVFAPVRQSLATGRPIAWRRVHALPDFVYFDHAVHVQKGVGCETCHGRVDRMARVEQVAPLTMGWCVGCHRDPAPALRPVTQMTTMGWRPPAPQARLGDALARRYHVQSLTTCTTCHR